MPELCRFYNVVIKMISATLDKLHKPHFLNDYKAYD